MEVRHAQTLLGECSTLGNKDSRIHVFVAKIPHRVDIESFKSLPDASRNQSEDSGSSS